jgi:hypothetical protein
MPEEHVANPQGTPDFYVQLHLAFVLVILDVRFFFYDLELENRFCLGIGSWAFVGCTGFHETDCMYIVETTRKT